MGTEDVWTDGGGAENRAAPRAAAPGTANELSGHARDVLQARTVYGGVHLHAASAAQAPRPPCLLPAGVPDFTDRRTQLAALDGLVERPAEVWTIAGPPGVGKTALVVHWARRVRDRFPDGQLYVDLRGYDAGPPAAPDKVLEGFLRALDVPGAVIPPDVDGRAGMFRALADGRRMLLVLDNAARPEQVRPLLPGSPTCTVLVTSRHRLSGLAAREGARRMTLDVLPSAEAVGLLRQIAGGPRVDEEPLAAEALVRLCGCLPLAVRIAAERVVAEPHTALADLVAELSTEHDRLDALSADPLGDDPTAVRAVFSWSYRELPPSAAQLFRFIGLHPGPVLSVTAAAALLGAPVARARRILAALTDAHLLEAVDRDRYGCHDLLRCYAAERAADEEAPEARGAAVRRLLAWYLSAAAAAAELLPRRQRVPALESVPDAVPAPDFATDAAALAWCERERDTLTSAVRLAADSGNHDIAWRLPLALGTFYNLRKYWTDWIDTHEMGLAAARRCGARAGEAWTLTSLGTAYRDTGRADDAVACYTAALDVFAAIGDRPGEASALNNLAHARNHLGRHDAAVEAFDRARTLYHDLGLTAAEGRALSNLGDAHRAAADALARAVAPEPSQTAPPDGTSHSARPEAGMGDAVRTSSDAPSASGTAEAPLGSPPATVSGHRSAAVRCLTEALELLRAGGDRHGEGFTLHNLAVAQLSADRAEEAAAAAEQALRLRRATGNRWGEARTLRVLGDARARLGDPTGARAHWAAALSLFEQLGDPEADSVRARLEQQPAPPR